MMHLTIAVYDECMILYDDEYNLQVCANCRLPPGKRQDGVKSHRWETDGQKRHETSSQESGTDVLDNNGIHVSRPVQRSRNDCSK